MFMKSIYFLCYAHLLYTSSCVQNIDRIIFDSTSDMHQTPNYFHNTQLKIRDTKFNLNPFSSRKIKNVNGRTDRRPET